MFRPTSARFFSALMFSIWLQGHVVRHSCNPVEWSELNRIHGAFVRIIVRHYNGGLRDLPIYRVIYPCLWRKRRIFYKRWALTTKFKWCYHIPCWLYHPSSESSLILNIIPLILTVIFGNSHWGYHHQYQGAVGQITRYHFRSETLPTFFCINKYYYFFSFTLLNSIKPKRVAIWSANQMALKPINRLFRCWIPWSPFGQQLSYNHLSTDQYGRSWTNLIASRVKPPTF